MLKLNLIGQSNCQTQPITYMVSDIVLQKRVDLELGLIKKELRNSKANFKLEIWLKENNLRYQQFLKDLIQKVIIKIGNLMVKESSSQ